MLIVDNIVFVHLHKCAGTSFGNAVQSLRGDDIQFVSTHAPVTSIPAAFRALRKVTLVRNPFEWYESWFNWSVKRAQFLSNRQSNPFNMLMHSADGMVNIHTFIDRATDLPRFFRENPKQLKEFKASLRDHKVAQWFKAILGDVTKLDANTIAPTLYQLLVSGMGVEESEIYRMEDQLIDVMNIAGIGERRLNRDNETFRIQKRNEEDSAKILKADLKLFEMFGYVDSI